MAGWSGAAAAPLVHMDGPLPPPLPPLGESSRILIPRESKASGARDCEESGGMVVGDSEPLRSRGVAMLQDVSHI